MAMAYYRQESPDAGQVQVQRRPNINSFWPTQVDDDRWLTWRNFTNWNSAVPYDCEGGCWLIFVDEENVDDCWADIRQATGEGYLGYASSVSSAGKNAWFCGERRRSEPYVICVKTYDCEDREDTMRIRNELYHMGFRWKLRYKTQQETMEDNWYYGLYNSHKN